VYGQREVAFPRRIVCLSAESAEIACALGAGDRVVGVPGTARRPAALRGKPRIGGFTTVRVDRILALEPDLVLAFSDLQKDVVRELVGAGLTVLCTNPRSFQDVLETILLIGGALGCERQARELVADMQDEVRQVREYSALWPDRPRVYFEEWPDPPIAGIGWVSDLIEFAGGRDIFADRARAAAARERVVGLDEVAARDPQIIFASWCGRPVDLSAIARRPGWARVSAVRTGHLYELQGADVLCPGPSLLVGLRKLHEAIQAFHATT
jgi:iron complex transport system substrate-binding protein